MRGLRPGNGGEVQGEVYSVLERAEELEIVDRVTKALTSDDDYQYYGITLDYEGKDTTVTVTHSGGSMKLVVPSTEKTGRQTYTFNFPYPVYGPMRFAMHSATVRVYNFWYNAYGRSV